MELGFKADKMRPFICNKYRIFQENQFRVKILPVRSILFYNHCV